MKKRSQKLSLNKETLRQLDPSDLEQAAGGGIFPATRLCTVICSSTCQCPTLLCQV